MFVAKGYDGTTMQSIADSAGFNKAQLHYYFRSKDALFSLIFEEEIGKILGTLRPQVLDKDVPILEKLDFWIERQMEFFRAFPQLPSFVITEVSRNPSIIQNLLVNVRMPELAQGLAATKDGPSLEAIQTALVSAMSLVIFPIVWEPIFRFVAKIDADRWSQILDRQIEMAKKAVRTAVSLPVSAEKK